MIVNRYIWKDLDSGQRARLLDRVRSNDPAIEAVVRDIINDVREHGDEALIEHTARLDGARIELDAIRVTENEFKQAFDSVSPDLHRALEGAHEHILIHHREQMPPPSWMKETIPGVISGERVTPIASVGLYVPRGKGSFPSVMLMLCTPAIIAGVERIAVCTPPGRNGSIDAPSLVAARLCGVDCIYKVGGAQAIAALAYGTQTVRCVDKIVGPGNQYVSAAKRILYGVIDPGPPAGPSESIVLADESADPQSVAYEWVVEAEHGPDSAALLVTDSAGIADEAEMVATRLAAKLPEPRRSFVEQVLAGHGGIVLTENLDASIDFVNAYAPEHLHILTQEPFEVLPRIVNAGEVLGPYTSIAFGNFSIGLNAILPTGGAARTYSSVGVHTFLKHSSFAHVSPQGARDIAPIAIELARWEGFPAHEAAAEYALTRGAEPTQ